MAENITIKARKISEVTPWDAFDVDTHADGSYLLISYKPSEAAKGINYRVSISKLINAILSPIQAQVGDEISSIFANSFKQTLIDMLKEDDIQSQIQSFAGSGGSNTGGGSGSGSGTGGTDTPSIPTKTDIVVSFNQSQVTTDKNAGESLSIQTINTNENVTFTYSSSNTSVATISGNSIKIVGNGTTQITASFAGNEYFNPASASYNLVVNAPISTVEYMFSYASEAQDGIFTKSGDTIIGVNINNILSLGYTQITQGTVPTSNKNGYGFCFVAGKSATKYAFTWDNAVDTRARVWIIVPRKFYDLDNDTFKDNSNNYWGIYEPTFKASFLSSQVDPVVIPNLYKGEDYVLICYNQEGANGKCWMGQRDDI